MASPRWTKVTDSGLLPKPRHGHKAVVVRGLMIVFGGGNEGIIDELHAYNTITNQWFSPIVKGDVPKGAAAFGLDSYDTRLFFFGGMVEFGHYSNKLYSLDVGPYFNSNNNIASKWEWKELHPKPPRFAPSPSPRLGHSFTFINGKFYMFGGLSNEMSSDDGMESTNIYSTIHVKYLNDLYVLDFRGNTGYWEMPQTYGNPPPPRESHSAVSHVDSLGNAKLLIYGGMAGLRLGDLWILDINSLTWHQPLVDGPKPLPRSLHTSSVVGDRMYIFGGWVPKTPDSKIFDREWICTNSLARLNLNTLMWEQFECPEVCPQPRAGHCAVVVGSRIYVWSGRDGYTRQYNTQVCCNDLWFLEVSKPDVGGRVHLIKANTGVLEVTWPEVAFCDNYVLQILKYTVTPPPKPPAPKKRKIDADFNESCQSPNQLPIESSALQSLFPSPIDKAFMNTSDFTEDHAPPPAGKIASPRPPVASSYISNPPLTVQMPSIDAPIVSSSATQHFVHTPSQSTPPKPMTSAAPSLLPQMGNVLPYSSKEVSPVMTQPPFSNSYTVAPSPARAIPSGPTVVKFVNSRGPVQSNKPQHVPILENTPVLNNSVQSSPNTPPSQQIVIQKPMNRMPSGQQIVVMNPSSQMPRAVNIPTVRSNFNGGQNQLNLIRPPNVNGQPPTLIRRQLKVSVGNGMTRTLTIHGRSPVTIQERARLPSVLQNPVNPPQKNLKLQVGGKTVMLMPASTNASSQPTGGGKVFYYPPKSQEVPTTTAPKMIPVLNSVTPPGVRHPNVGPKFRRVQGPGNATCVDLGEVDKRLVDTMDTAFVKVPENLVRNNVISADKVIPRERSTIKIVAPRVNVIQTFATPKPTTVASPTVVKSPADTTLHERTADNSEMPSSTTNLDAHVSRAQPSSEKNTSRTPSDDSDRPVQQSKPEQAVPPPPSNIRIAKTADGAIVSWQPPTDGFATSYCINLGLRIGNCTDKVEFATVYEGPELKTKISQDLLDRAVVGHPRPAIIFRVSSQNNYGQGPSTQVRWLQDSQKVPQPAQNGPTIFHVNGSA